MNNVVQAALNARNEERKKKEQELYSSSVSRALAEREKTLDDSLSANVPDWAKRIATTVEEYNKHTSSSAWGSEYLQNARQTAIDAENLIRESELYRKYLGDDKTDEYLSYLNTIKDNYTLRSSFDSEDAYKAWYEEYLTTTAQNEKYAEMAKSEQGKLGWEKYLADVEAAEKAKAEKEASKPWWEKLLGYYGNAGIGDTSMPMGNVPQVVDDVRNGVGLTDSDPRDTWTDEQKRVYGYLYQESKAEAASYARTVNAYNAKYAEEEALRKIAEASTSSGWAMAGNTIASIVSAPLAMGDLLSDLVNSNAGKEIKEYDGVVSPFEYSQAVTGSIGEHLNEYGTLDEDIPIIGGKGFGDVYGLGTSILQSAASGYTLGGVGTLVSYFGQGAAAGIDDAKRRGASDAQAVGYGILLGAFEGIAESIGIDNLFKMSNSRTLKELLKNVFKQAGAEGLEEGLTSIASNIADAWIMQDKSNFNIALQEYMRNGMSESDAKWKVFWDSIEGIVYDTLGGAVSGGVHGGFHTAITSALSSRETTKYGQSLIDNNSVPELQALAREMMGVSKDVDKMSIKTKTNANAKNVGRLAVAMQDSIKSQNLTDVTNALVEKGLSQNEAQKVAEKLINNESLSKKQMSNEAIKAVAEEIINNPDSAMNERKAKLRNARLGVKTNASETQPGEVAVNKKVDVTDRVSADGVTKLTSTGEAITIDKSNPIAKTKDGKVYFNTDKGVVESSDVSYASADEGLIYEAFVDMNPAFANALIRNYDGKTPVQSYIKGMREGLIIYGRHNFQGIGKDISGATYFAELSEADQAFALKLGRNYATYEAKVKDAPVRQMLREATKRANTEGANKTAKTGTVGFEKGINKHLLNKEQRGAVELANHLVKALGIDIVFYDARTKKEGENGYNDNGFYDPETNTIHLDLQKSHYDNKTIAYTLSHELVHWLKAKSATDFNNFAKFLMEQYAEHGVDTEKFLDQWIDKGYSPDEAYEEMICDACETLLLDSNAVVKLMKLREQDMGLFERIKLHIAEILNKLRNMYKKYDGRLSDEAKALRSMTDVLEQIYEKFEDAMVGAVKNAEVMGVSMEFTVNDAMTGTDISDITKKPTVKMQEKTEYFKFPKEVIKITKSGSERTPMDIKINGKRFTGEASVRELRNARFAENKFDPKIVEKINNFLDKMKEYLVEAREKYVYVGLKDIYEAKIIISPTTGSIVLSGLVNNGDYEINFDFTKTCKKKIALQEVIEQLAREKGTKNEDGTQTEVNLSEENIRHINEVLAANGIETACLCCFVESKRYAIQSHFQEKVCDVWNRLVDEVNAEDGITKEAPYFNFADQNVNDSKIPDGEYDRLYADLDRWRNYKFEDDGEGEGAVERKMKAFLINTPNARKKLRLADFVTESGRTNLHKLYPDIESLAKAKIGTALPKAIEAFAPYNGEIELLEVSGKEDLATYAMKIAGARSQSFSDYLMSHVYDVLQKTASLSARKLTAHTYTKEISRARLFGMTGEKTNMSVLHEIDPKVDSWNAGLHEDGSYFVSDYEAFKNKKCGQIQSIPDAESIALQNTDGYSKDCGRIGVGFSYTHMLKMHNDPDIRQTIGYHSSSLPLVLKPLTNLDKATDYTPVQNTLNFNGFRKPNFDIPDGIPSYATPPQDIEPWFKTTSKGKQSTQRMSKYSKSDATFDIKGKYAELCETMDSTKAAKETLRQLLQFAEDNGLALVTSKAKSGRGDFELYVDTEKTQNPYLSADHYIEYCISNGLIPMFYEFALNDNYYKDIYDFNPFDRLSYNPETGLHEDSVDRKAYAPQNPVHMVNEDGTMAFPDDFWELVDKYMRDYNYQREDFAKKFPKIMKEVRAIKDAEGIPMVSKSGIKKQVKAPLSDKQKANFDYNRNNTEIGSTLKTLAGTPIRRYRGVVGKEVGGQVYVHKNYVSDAIPQEKYKKALNILQQNDSNFEFNTVMYDKNKGTIRFDEAPDFDTAREPIAGNFVTVNMETGGITSGYSDYIWHHKWMWVKNDYKGFDVAESWNWSKEWLSVIRATEDKVSNRGIANGTGHGTKNWDAQLTYFGLPLDHSGNSRLKHQKKVDPVKPTSDKWQVGHSESWFYENGFPLYRSVPEEQRTANEKAEMEKRKGGHGTQNKSTLPTYEKIFTYIKNNFEDWENVRILDASSGLGYGTKTGKEMGLDIHDIEPFPNASYNPEWRDYGKLQDMVENGEVEPFDIIISNAVLNVLAQDARDGLVSAMASLLSDGGQMFINVIGKDYAGAKNATSEIQYNNKGIPVGTVLTQEGENGAGREVFVWGSNSIQKVFGKDELSAYLSDALGSGYKIETPASAWKGSNLSGTMLVLTKNEGIKNQVKKQAKKNTERILMGSLFSGGGTLEAGLVYQMLDKEFAVEYKASLASAYTDNFGKEHMFVGDVRDFNSKEKRNVFYLHASPVCKSYSPANHSGGERNDDIITAQATARILEEQMPEVFTVENVKQYRGSEAYNIIVNKLNELGYTWDVDVYKASDYGNATKRERMIIRAVKNGELPAKPQKVSNITSWGEATKDLWETDLIPSTLVKSKYEAIKNTPELRGINLTKLDKPLMIYDTTKRKTITFAWADELSPTLTTKCGDARIIMPDGIVYAPTPKFMGRIQGLPDNYKYPKATTNAFKIIGNGIPTQLTKAVIGGVLDSAYMQTHNGKVLHQKKRESNRTILANALETTIDTSTQEGQNELKKLKEYQGVVAELDNLEAHLADVMQQIHDISFTKGSDRSKLTALNDDKIKTQNRIHIYDKRLTNLESMKPIKDVLAREKEAVRVKTEAKAKLVFDAYREYITKVHKEDIGKERDKKKVAVANVRETQAKQDAKKKLHKLVLETIDWIEHPAKTDIKCPDMLKAPFHDFLKSINLDSKRALDGGLLTKNDLRIDSAMNSLANKIEKLRESQASDKEGANGFLDLPGDFVRVLRDMADDITEKMEALGSVNYVVNGGLTADDIKTLSKLIRTLVRSIKTMNTLYANLRFANAQMLGVEAVGFLDSMGKAEKTSSIKDFVLWDNGIPYYVFKRFGEAGESVFEEFMDAQDKMAYNAKKILEFRENTWTDKEANEWSNDRHVVRLPRGISINLTTADAMSIYCLSRRNDGNGDKQGMKHLLGGGVRIIGIKKGTSKFADEITNLSEADIDEIIDSLSDRQKQVAEAMQEFMSTVGSAWGNEISMKRFLTKDFVEKIYFPIESDNQNLKAELPEASQGDLYRLLNISATKSTNKYANNRLVVRNIFDVFTNHMSDMAKLNAFGMALLDYMKWVNYKESVTTDAGEIVDRSVRQSMNNTYGDEAIHYVLNLIKDINGRHTDNGDNQFLMKMIRLGKTASVGNNLRVAFLQFTSYPRAAMVLSNKSLAMGLTKVPNLKMAEKYCGIALWKSFGFYDTNIARSIEDQIKGATNIRQKIIELSMTMPGLADAITWGALWNACEYEVSKTTTNTVGSEEFYQEVGKKLREVVYATQVVDSVLTRSQIMRSKSGLTQMATAYMGEPTLTANILMDAGFQFEMEKRISGSPKTAWKKTSKAIIGAVGNYCVLQLLTSLAESLADAWRDDEDEEFDEKFKSAFVENLITNIIPVNKLPILSDIADTILSFFGMGYASSDNMATTWLTQIADAVKVWSEVLGEKLGGEDTSKTVYNAIYKTAKALSSVTGISVSGAMREVVALWNNTAGEYDSTLKLRMYESSNDELGNELYEAILEGNDRQADSLRDEFEDEDSANSALRKAIRNGYKDGNISRSKAMDMLTEHGGMESNEAYWKLKEWDYYIANGTTESYSKYTEFYEAVRTGSNLKAVINEHLTYGAEKSDLASQITKYYKPLYREMSNSERASLKGYLLNAYALLGYNRAEKSKDIDKWLKD